VIDRILIPPRRAQRSDGAWALSDPLRVFGDDADRVAVRQLIAELTAKGVRATRTRRAGSADVRFAHEAGTGAEAYRLTVEPSGATVAASTPEGRYYGCQTLRQLLRAADGSAIPAVRIDDAPALARRGVYLDISRGRVPTLRRLKDLVEQLAHWKINELQLNVENVFRFERHPQIGRGYSPLTAGDVTSLREHAKAHHVRLVGALASLGHQEKILQLPAYRDLAELPGENNWPGGTTFCPTDPRSIRLIEEFYDEYIPLFEAEDFNVNGDEPWELGRGRSRSRASEIGVGGLYAEFIGKLHRLVTGHGKRMNMWSDIVLEHPESLEALPGDIVMLNWDYQPDGARIPRTREIVQRGLACVVCPGTSSWNTHGGRLATGMANIARFAREGLDRGAEGLLNTDWGDNGHRNALAVSLHNLAYGAACAWAGDASDEGFTERFCEQTFTAGRSLADAVAALGTPLRDAATVPYGALIPPVQWGWHAMTRALDRLAEIDVTALKARRDAAESLRWPDARDVGRFEGEMLAEYALAGELEAVACRRCEWLTRRAAGKAVDSGTWRDLAGRTEALAGRFGEVWRLGNRPSRLREILAGFAGTIEEYRSMS
jgi:hypothetical protein